MFQELPLASWAQLIAVLAFVVSLLVFGFFLVGAIRMPKKKVDHDAALPLNDEKSKRNE